VPLRARLDRPTPRITAGRSLAGLAHTAIDLSDGLGADLAHICHASNVAAEVWLTQLPASPDLTALYPDASARWHFQVSGGDDYELCVTAVPEQREQIQAKLAAYGVPLTRIGRIHATSTPEVRLMDANNTRWQPERAGFMHFATD